MANSAEELAAINLPDVNIATWKRPQLHTLESKLRLVSWPSMLGISGTFLKNKPDQSFEQLQFELNNILSFLNNDEKNELIQDVMENTSLFFHSFSDNANSFKYELSVINEVMCPKFHMDYYQMRLIVTYVGDGTEWTTNDNIELDGQGKPVQPIIIIDPDNYHRVEPMSVTLLKGNQYKPGHLGVVHRSPSKSDCQGERLLLRFDA